MQNADYWRNRAEILEAAKNKSAGYYTAAVQQQFNLAQKKLDEQIEQWYGRFAKNNQITLAEARQWLTGKDLAEFKWDVSEYIKHGKDAMIDPVFIKQLENASARFHISKLEALKLKTQATVEQLYGQTEQQTTSLFGKIYADNYYHTAFTLQQGFGVGWDIAALNSHQIESVLSKPWTLDKQTFSDRIWKQKSELLSEVHTRLTQNMILGKAPDDAIKTIAKNFNTSKSNAGRLVMTESAYFATEAQRKAFETLDVEEFEVVATLDSHTSLICQGMDRKHFPMSQFESGVTAPPFHPWCRSAVAPYFADDEGERVARDEGSGKSYYVPQDMTYKDWKKTFADGGDKSGFVKAFQSSAQYKKSDGSFDLEKAKADYLKFLQTVPEKSRMYLEQAMGAVGYEERKLPDAPFGYLPKADTIYFDPTQESFFDYDFTAVNTHELAHRVDVMFVRSWKNELFSKAIREAKGVIKAAPEAFILFCKENDSEGFLSDVFDAICDGDYRFPFQHEKDYWKNKGRKEMEVFANLYSLEAFQDDKKLKLIRESLPELYKTFEELWR